VTREELTAIADVVITNWNLGLGGDRRKEFYRAWWRYLADLDVTETQKAIDACVLADKPFPPRAGTIRRMVLVESLSDIPTMELAWAAATNRIRSIEQGTWFDVPPLVAKALTEAHISGTSREDRESFIRAWRRVVEELELERLGLPEEVES
jgi:hypothetical protein